MDLLSFIFILHNLNQYCKFVRWSWRLFIAESKIGLDEVIAVSSAKVARLVLFDWGRSAIYIYILDKVGGRIVPWGTPALIRGRILRWGIMEWVKRGVYKEGHRARHNQMPAQCREISLIKSVFAQGNRQCCQLFCEFDRANSDCFWSRIER